MPEDVKPVGSATGNDTGIDTSDERAAFDTVDEGEDKGAETESDGEAQETEEETGSEGDTEESSDETEDTDEVEGEDQEGAEGDKELASDNLYQELKKRDPKLLKEMPQLKAVIFRERRYTELFPSIDDAQEAKGRSDVLSDFERDVTSGSSENLIKALEGTGKQNLENFVANFIPTIEKQNKDLYLGMLYPEFKKLFRAAVRSGDQNLKTSAENLNWFVFNNTDVASDAGLKAFKEDPKDKEINERERAINQRLYNSFASDVQGVATRRLQNVISSPFKDSDLSEFMVKKLTDEIFARVDAEVKKDVRHMGNMNQLWKQAAAQGFTSEGKDRITNAYLSRAKLLIAKYRQQVLSEAKVSAKIRPGVAQKRQATRITPSSTSVGRVPGKIEGKKVNWDKTSERDLLDGKVSMK